MSVDNPVRKRKRIVGGSPPNNDISMNGEQILNNSNINPAFPPPSAAPVSVAAKRSRRNRKNTKHINIPVIAEGTVASSNVHQTDSKKTRRSNQQRNNKIQGESPLNVDAAPFVPGSSDSLASVPKEKRKFGKSKPSENDPKEVLPASSASPAGVTSVTNQQPRRQFGRAFRTQNMTPSSSVPNVPAILNEDSNHMPYSKTHLTPLNPRDELRVRLTKELRWGKYECAVCVSSVYFRSKIWSCGGCSAVFHLKCIKDWAISLDRQFNAASTSANNNTTSFTTTTTTTTTNNKKKLFHFRCPNCQKSHETPHLPQYECYCGSRANPPTVENPNAQMPHSCQKRCQKPFTKAGRGCDHPCPLICHPGPCPPCTFPGFRDICGCGRSSQLFACGERSKNDGKYSCGMVCGKMLSCGKHSCAQSCHDGPCSDCPELKEAVCDCGKEKKKIKCAEAFNNCDRVCGETLACGQHTCQSTCHPIGKCPPCRFSPSLLLTCPCGKDSSLPGILNRISCTDPIATCGKVCNRLLFHCSHRCPQLCHTGPCAPCEVKESTPCRCGSNGCISLTCHERYANGREATCNLSCKTLKTCGKHKCQTLCCPSRGIRQTDAHRCLIVCNKPLSCGIHNCDAFCHVGPCKPCGVIYRQPLSCACGTQILQPPVVCGSQSLPSCSRPCSIAGPLDEAELLLATDPNANEDAPNLSRALPCGHKCLAGCHEGPCPPCTERITKMCVGGHVLLNNITCSSSGIITCAKSCGRVLPCGHTCRLSCHAHPDEEDGNSYLPNGMRQATSACLTSLDSCERSCDAPRRFCGHPCGIKCHGKRPEDNSYCDEVAPCTALIDATCQCGLVAAKIPCLVSSVAPQSEESGIRFIPCTQECEDAKRLKQFREAFSNPSRETVYDAALVLAFKPHLAHLKKIEQIMIQALVRKQTTAELPGSSASRRQLDAWYLMLYYRCVDFSYSQHETIAYLDQEYSREPYPLLSTVIQRTADELVGLEPPLEPRRRGPVIRWPSPGVCPAVVFNWVTINTHTQDILSVFVQPPSARSGVEPLDEVPLRVCWINDEKAVVEFLDDSTALRAYRVAKNLYFGHGSISVRLLRDDVILPNDIKLERDDIERQQSENGKKDSWDDDKHDDSSSIRSNQRCDPDDSVDSNSFSSSEDEH